MLGVSDYVGFDLRYDQRVAEQHGDHFLVHDATNPNWTGVCPRGSAGLVVVAPPVFTFGHSADTTLPTDLGALRDPEDYLAALAIVLAAANSVLGVGGTLAVVVRNTSEFRHGAPVPNIVHQTTRLIEELGFECFTGCPILTTGRWRQRERHDGPWIVPEVRHVVTYRKSFSS
jgi:hypothetical protein